MKTKDLEAFALKQLRASQDNNWSYLFVDDTFGFFLWEWSEENGLDVGDREEALKLAESGEHGIAWIVPIQRNGIVEGYALFTGHAGSAPEDEPVLEGVFKDADAAASYLESVGVTARP